MALSKAEDVMSYFQYDESFQSIKKRYDDAQALMNWAIPAIMALKEYVDFVHDRVLDHLEGFKEMDPYIEERQRTRLHQKFDALVGMSKSDTSQVLLRLSDYGWDVNLIWRALMAIKESTL